MIDACVLCVRSGLGIRSTRSIKESKGEKAEEIGVHKIRIMIITQGTYLYYYYSSNNCEFVTGDFVGFRPSLSTPCPCLSETALSVVLVLVPD